MKTIILIACVKSKLDRPAPAGELYTSPLFRKNLAYARSLQPDHIFVLSAKYGLLELDQVIAPYELTLKSLSTQQRRDWARHVLAGLERKTDLRRDRFIFLAGQAYRQHLLPYLANFEIPLLGLSIGQQLQALTQNAEPQNQKERHNTDLLGVSSPSLPITSSPITLSNICAALHAALERLPHHYFPFEASRMPRNGLYVLFEAGEEAHGCRRIVRIGTHTGPNQLPARLTQHFIQENKDRSIFRKNIGRALLNRDGDPFLAVWELDLTTSAAKAQYGHLVDPHKRQAVERRVTDCIQGNFEFIVIPVDDREERLWLEARLISTVSGCPDCWPSQRWLGLHSPKDKIRTSGLWQVNELYKKPLSPEEFSELLESLND
jgi:hypothetical protein